MILSGGLEAQVQSITPSDAPIGSHAAFLNLNCISGGSLRNNQAWVSQEIRGGGGLGLINTQWSEIPVLDGLVPAADVTWNTLGAVNCSMIDLGAEATTA